MRRPIFSFSGLFKLPPVRGFGVLCAVLATIATVAAAYFPIRAYARRITINQAATSSVAIALAHEPAWITPALSSSILAQARDFAQETSKDPLTVKPVKNFARLQNPLDGGILTELAGSFTAHRAQRSNAWIENIVAIHRIYNRVLNRQEITVDARYRKPVALVAHGDAYYPVDDQGVVLPGDLSEQDALKLEGQMHAALLVIRGTNSSLPQPGGRFTGEDFSAALELAGILSSQPYGRQLSGINVSNYAGRVDKMAPQITLDTAYGTQIWWGRPAHDETFYEVSLPTKLKTLARIVGRYSRIDALHRYVDIRFEQPRIPISQSTLTQANHIPATVPYHG